MKIMAFNGSPRIRWNTGTLLAKALEGAASQGADTELIHLYDLTFKGCVSCFACKTKGGRSYGRCAVRDELAPVLNRVESADAVILGSPIYFGTVTGEMRSFMERMLFPYLVYADPPQSLFPRKIRTGFIYTMNVPEAQMQQFGVAQCVAHNERVLKLLFGSSESLCSFDTCQFDDYSKMVAPRFDPVAKAERRKTVFPDDCRKAFEMGARLATIKL